MNKNEEMEIDLLKLFKALWKRALVIILVALIFAAAFFAGRADACLFCTQFPPNVVYMRACALRVSGGAVRRAGYSE